MTGNERDQKIEELKASLKRVQEELSALIVRSSGSETGTSDRIAGHRDEENASPEAGEERSGVRKSFDAVRTGGERLLKDLAAVIERYPVGAAAAAFGLGFIVATLMRKGGGRGKSDH